MNDDDNSTRNEIVLAGSSQLERRSPASLITRGLKDLAPLLKEAKAISLAAEGAKPGGPTREELRSDPEVFYALTDLGEDYYNSGVTDKAIWHATLYRDMEDIAEGLGEDLEPLFPGTWEAVTGESDYIGGTGGVYGSVKPKGKRDVSGEKGTGKGSLGEDIPEEGAPNAEGGVAGGRTGQNGGAESAGGETSAGLGVESGGSGDAGSERAATGFYRIKPEDDIGGGGVFEASCRKPKVFKPDYGLRLLREGISTSVNLFFYDFRLYSLTVLGYGQYSTTVEMPYAGEIHALSLDFDQAQLDKILSKASPQIRILIETQIAGDPINLRTIRFDGYASFGVRARLGELQKVERESFVPLVAQEIFDFSS